MYRLSAILVFLAFPLFGAFPDICERCWYEVPDSKLDSVAQSPTPPGVSGTAGIMYWNGGAFDTRRNRLIVTGGGAPDYAGNEVYAFDVDSLKWFRIKNGAGTYDELDSLHAYYLNGGAVPDSQQPRPGYNYDQIEYDSISDNLYILGAPFAYRWGTGYRNVFQLNMATLTWSHPTDVGPQVGAGSVSGRDPATGKIWSFINGWESYLGVLDPSGGDWTDHGDMWLNSSLSTNQNAAYMPPTKRLISVGVGNALYWDTDQEGNIPTQELETSGCDSLLAVDAPGFEWSPKDGKMVGWAGGTKVYTMDTAYACEEIAASEENEVVPDSPVPYGTFGRWRYVPKYNVFIVVNSTSGSVYFYRHSPAPGDSTPPVETTVEITSPAEDSLTNRDTIAVAWKVNGETQTTQVFEVLELEGENLVIRCSGTDCDTVIVIRDRTPPVVVITSPGEGDTVTSPTVQVNYTVDGTAHSPFTFTLHAGINTIIAQSTDPAGNTGADTVHVYHPCVMVSGTVHYNQPEYRSCIVVQNGGSLYAHGKLTADSVRVEQGGQLITDDTLQAGKVTVKTGGLLTHSALTTTQTGYHVQILASKIVVDSAGDINATGKGYPLGRTPGGFTSTLLLRGGVHAGSGNGSAAPNYGNQFTPVLPGGGAGSINDSVNGGRGGGVVRLTADTISIRGRVRADGGLPNSISYGSGAGGSVWIEAGKLQGDGTVSARGGMTGYFGGGGRVALYADSLPDALAQKASAKGYGAGTVYLEDRRGFHTLRIDSAITTPTSTSVLTPPSDSLLIVTLGPLSSTTFSGNIRIGEMRWTTGSSSASIPGKMVARKVSLDSGDITLGDTCRIDTLLLDSVAVATHRADKADTVWKVHVISDYIRVASKAKIDVRSKGYPEGVGPNGLTSSLTNRGGSHGGLGYSATFPVYGSRTMPYLPGSGGGSTTTLQRPSGGGMVRLAADRIDLGGSILADGGNQSSGGGGAGGSVWITADSLGGTGKITANGGTSAYQGGGGRVAVQGCAIAQTIRDSIQVSGYSPGTIHLPCYQVPLVEIVSPANGSVVYNDTTVVHWKVDEALMTVDTLAFLSEGWNNIIRCYTNPHAFSACDTARVWVDEHPPVVQIQSPLDNSYTKASIMGVAWTVDGVTQTTQTSAFLTEGLNTIIRSYTDSMGAKGADTARVILDTRPPVIEPIRPIQSGLVMGSPVSIRWKVDSVEQVPISVALDTTVANWMMLRATDSAGNQDSLPLFFYAGKLVPNVVGLTQVAAESLLTAAGFQPESVWVVNNTVTTGVVFAQSPAAGDTSRYHFPIRYSLSKGVDSKDLRPLSLAADSMTVNPNTLAAGGTVTVRAVNEGRAAVADSFDVLIFEDRNLDGRYSSGTDLILGQAMNRDALSAADTTEWTIPVSGSLAFNGNRISVFLDAGGRIAEIHEDNNSIHSMAACRKLPSVVDYAPQVKWTWRDTATGYASVFITPLVANMNDDNGDSLINAEDIPDIIVVGTANALFTGYTSALDGKTGAVLWQTKADHFSLAEQAVGDVDGDGKPEVVLVQCGPFGWERRLVILDNEGDVKSTGAWRYFGSVYFVPDGINLSDLDGDGKSEIIWGNNVHDYNANLVFPKKFDFGFSPLASVDVNADGYKELIGRTTIPTELASRLGVISYREKRNLYRSTTHNPPQFNVIGRVENDSGPRLIVSTSIYPDTAAAADLFGMQANFIKKYRGAYLETNPPGVYDPNTTGQRYPFYFGTDSTRMLFEIGSVWGNVPGTGTYYDLPFMSRLNLRDSSKAYRIFNHPNTAIGTVFDLDDDGKPEAILVTDDTLYVLSSDADVLARRALPAHSGGNRVTVADVDKDGRADIVLGMGNLASGVPGIMVFSNPTWVGARGIYNQIDYTVTNVDDDGGIPRFAVPHWQANNTANVQCAEGHYACVDISASFPQITVDSLGLEHATARIGNGGALELPAGIPISLYSTHLGVETLLDTLLTPSRLKPGQYYTASFPLPAEMRGSFTFRFAADDSGNGHGNLDESSETNNQVSLTYLLNDQAPIVVQPANQYAEADEDFDFQIEATDADEDTLTYTLLHGPSGMTLNAATGAIHWHPSRNPPRCTVQVSVADPYQGSSSVSFIVYVGNEDNDPPTISSTPGTTAALNTLTSEHTSVYSYAISAADPESEGILEYELTCLNCEGKPGSPPNLAGNTVSWIPFNPAWKAGDSVQLSLRVIDARGGIATQNWTIHLYRTSNSAPAFVSILDTTAAEDAPWRSPVSVADLDEDDVTLLLDTIPVGMSFSNDSLRWTPSRPGSYVVRIGADDGFDTTWQRFVVVVSSVNDAPVIVTAAPAATIPGALYAYHAVATDEDGDAVTFSLAQTPSGMTVSSAGLVEWRPSQSQTASVTVELVARDPSNAEDRQIWTLHMVPDTIAPTAHISFSKNPVRPGGPVTVTVQTGDNVDVSSSVLTLDGTPVTLTGNQYVFTPTTTGDRLFRATATDPSSNVGTASGSLRVSNSADLTPPEVHISISPEEAETGETVTFTVTATDTDGVDESRLWVEVDGVSLRVEDGQAQYTALRPGTFTARAFAFDSLGASAFAQAAFTVSPEGGDAVAPTAHIDSPAEDSVLYVRIALVGTASDAHLAYYTLSYRDLNASAWVEYARNTSSVTADTLGYIDATGLPNGDYDIRLVAYDRSGNSTTRTVRVTVAGEKKIGAFTLAFEDLSIPMSGLPLTVTRGYDSRDKTPGDFGYGWRMGMRSIALHENRNQGEDWVIHRSPGMLPQYSIGEGAAHHVTVTLPGGRKQEFTPKPRFFSPFNPSYGVMEYEARPGTYSRLEAVAVDTFVVIGSELYDEHGDFEETFNPQRYRLTLLDGSYFVYDQSAGGVVESGDANGNTLTWEANAIRHNAGSSLSFTRDSLNRITSLSDAQGRGMQYRYDVAGNLHEVLDANGQSTRFRYGPDHYLEEVIDARGVRAARTEYDADGRLVRQINANGDTLKLTHDLEASTEEVEDFAGHVTTYTYDERGNVLTKTDDADQTWSYAYDSVGNLLSTLYPGGAERSSTYDSHGNELTSIDELGHTTTRTYDAGGRVLTSRDPLNRTTTYAYDASGNLETEIGPDAVVQSVRTYDSRGNLLTEENALGHLTTHTYNTLGWLTSTTDPLGRLTEYFHDAAGNVIREVHAAGDTTRYAYDGTGNRTLTVGPLRDSVRTEYNAIGKVTRQIDALGNMTRYAYNALGDKVADTTADGAVILRAYDAAGNVASVTDPVGRVTAFEYDHEKRLTKTTFEDESSTTTEYDALGRRVRSVDANGNETEYGYDAAGRDTLVRDALGHETHFEYDAAGRKTATVDALGYRTEYEYDAYDRLVLTRFEDGTTKLTGYDLAGRKISETDQAGKETGFEYDSTGNLTAVVDALDNRTEYTYDENNNRLTQKDANNHTTSMEYDALGRLLRKTYPGGDQERWHYDANGNAVSHVTGTDSTAYQFDALNREVHRHHFPSGHEVTTSYTLDGKRDSVTDYRGLTRFMYDNRGRLSAEGMPNGDFLEHDYDAQGNRTRVVTPFDTTEYRYDALNRMDSVVTRSGVTRYLYNAVGNRDSVLYTNGISTGYSYDSLNRLTEVRNWSPADTLLSRFTYTLNPAGIRTAVAELGGSVVTYTYDDLYRLTGETRTGSHAYTRSYGYDDVGNRLFQVVNGDTTVYSYNSRDQLEEEDAPGGTTAYDYDAAGRLVSKETVSGETTYLWVDEDRLDSVSGPGVAVGYAYDADGRKIKETIPDTVRQFLVDGLLPYGQVILETDGAGDMVAGYVYGLERISQERNGASHWYLADGQGSVRQLADTNGFVSDSYAYTAFGEPLASTGPTANEFRYVGEQADPNSGFYYLRARWMDPKVGRFASVDPYKGKVGRPISQHRYLYADVSPINRKDPSGQMTLIDVASPGNQSVQASYQVISRTSALNSWGWFARHLVVGLASTAYLAEIGWNAEKQREWEAAAKKEPAERLQHYTTEAGYNGIRSSKVIKTGSDGFAYFTPGVYFESEEATEKLAVCDRREWAVSLKVHRTADGLGPDTRIKKFECSDGTIRAGGGFETRSSKPVILGTYREPIIWWPLTD